jgi:hypothetical protein
MRIVFSSLFRDELHTQTQRYTEISPRLGEDFSARVKAAVRTVVSWQGGDHVGPHGYPCRRCRPFPFIVYYHIAGDTLHVLGLVHERRHPDFLREQLGKNE